ncbi:hypothetical protein TUBRATIS_29490 [Tubulinosema ratisbonensis]|uniref:Uncharacterized protein n=1 Tax=Tubulinosema ratisbonensis TaxID=291195 RepID=A0A437AHL8_9MICR|nr:hypothetical protein TUBRATIS_29490 [Tubulinosema ratisbonensis]
MENTNTTYEPTILEDFNATTPFEQNTTFIETTTESNFNLCDNSLEIIEANKNTIINLIYLLIRKAIFRCKNVYNKNEDTFKRSCFRAVNEVLKPLAEDIFLNSESEEKLKKFFEVSIKDYETNFSLSYSRTKYERRALRNLKINEEMMRKTATLIYNNFSMKFEYLKNLPVIKKSDLDQAALEFHCESKEDIFGMFLKNVTMQNFLDCSNPLLPANDTNAYIPYINARQRRLYFEYDPSQQIQNKSKNNSNSDGWFWEESGLFSIIFYN